jgi:hypothetical protein
MEFYSRHYEMSLWRNLWLPLAMTWLGVENSAGYNTGIGPLLLMFAAPGLLVQRKQRDRRVTSILLVGAWILIAIASLYSVLLSQTRLYFCLLPTAALAAGWGWQALQSISIPKIRPRRVLGAIVLLVLVLCLIKDAVRMVQLNPAGVVLGVQSRDEYLDNALGWYSPAMRALYELPEDAQTLMLWEPRGLYAPVQSTSDTWVDLWYLVRQTAGEPEAIITQWREQGYTHLLVHHTGADFVHNERVEYTTADWIAHDTIVSSLTELERFGESYALYSLAENP